MNTPFLSLDERTAINSGRWFSALSAPLKHDILRCAYVERYRDGELVAAHGEQPEAWHRLWRAPKPGGVVYASYKLGKTERVDEAGRAFTDADEARLSEWLNPLQGIARLETWLTTDQRPGQMQTWLNALVFRQPAAR